LWWFITADFAEQTATTLREAAGFDAASFSDPMAALDALENANSVELLVTCVEFQPGRASASRADDGALIRANVGRERHVVEAGQGGFCRSNASACASHSAAISSK
jgi:hypothetical protein